MRNPIMGFIYFLILAFGLSGEVKGQKAPDTTKVANSARTNFAVPDAPAFKILNLEGSEIHRPTSSRQLAIAVSDILKLNNNITLPQQFAIEFSPGMLMGGKSLSVNEYVKKHVWYQTRISIATARDEGSTTATKFAIGVRSTLTDKSDMRMNHDFVKAATDLADSINNFVSSLISGPADQADIDKLRNRLNVKTKIAELENDFVRNKLEAWTEDHWNARMDEIAAAILFQSPDSTAEKLELQQFSAWFTSARGIGSSAQILLGVRASMTRQEFGSGKYNSNLTVSSRVYSGTNMVKIFAEGQFAALEDQRSEWLLNSGGEMHLKDGFWIEFSAGGVYNTAVKHTRLVTEFELKYGL